MTVMSRRQAMLGLAGACVVRGADAGLRFRDLDHVEFTVADVDKSVDFYVKLFGGGEVMKNKTTTRRYIKLGPDYMAIDRADAARIDHFCVGIERFDIAALHAYLTQKVLAYRDYPSGKDLAVTDPDGTKMQMAAADGWSSLAAGTAAREDRAGGEKRIFQPMGLDHVLVNVTDVNESTAHYERLLGPTQRGVRRPFRVGAGLV
ncbi:MAG: VOC family protein, partial [Acidobacteriota bacterium]